QVMELLTQISTIVLPPNSPKLVIQYLILEVRFYLVVGDVLEADSVLGEVKQVMDEEGLAQWPVQITRELEFLRNEVEKSFRQNERKTPLKDRINELN
ncbi:MAG: hypothetical protein ACFFCQ_17410, partial [Promethearchaeota archaeon]